MDAEETVRTPRGQDLLESMVFHDDFTVLGFKNLHHVHPNCAFSSPERSCARFLPLSVSADELRYVSQAFVTF